MGTSSPQYIFRLAVLGQMHGRPVLGARPRGQQAARLSHNRYLGKSWAPNIQKQLSPGRCSWGKLRPAAQKSPTSASGRGAHSLVSQGVFAPTSP